MWMKWPITIVLFLTGLLPSICRASDSSLSQSPDWEKSVYFCEVTKQVSLMRDQAKEGELFKFKMTVAKDGVTFSENSFHNLNKIEFNGRYDWWEGANTRFKTKVSFSTSVIHNPAYNKGYFVHSSHSNMFSAGPYADVSVVFADCLDFKD